MTGLDACDQAGLDAAPVAVAAAYVLVVAVLPGSASGSAER
mgnify:CR=1 FL=1